MAGQLEGDDGIHIEFEVKEIRVEIQILEDKEDHGGILAGGESH